MNATKAIFKIPTQTQDFRDNMVNFWTLKMTTLLPISHAWGGIFKIASVAFITITLGLGVDSKNFKSFLRSFFLDLRVRGRGGTFGELLLIIGLHLYLL